MATTTALGTSLSSGLPAASSTLVSSVTVTSIPASSSSVDTVSETSVLPSTTLFDPSSSSGSSVGPTGTLLSSISSFTSISSTSVGLAKRPSEIGSTENAVPTTLQTTTSKADSQTTGRSIEHSRVDGHHTESSTLNTAAYEGTVIVTRVSTVDPLPTFSLPHTQAWTNSTRATLTSSSSSSSSRSSSTANGETNTAVPFVSVSPLVPWTTGTANPIGHLPPINRPHYTTTSLTFGPPHSATTTTVQPVKTHSPSGNPFEPYQHVGLEELEHLLEKLQNNSVFVLTPIIEKVENMQWNVIDSVNEIGTETGASPESSDQGEDGQRNHDQHHSKTATRMAATQIHHHPTATESNAVSEQSWVSSTIETTTASGTLQRGEPTHLP